jgi:gliding motility-associated protein GldM
MINMMYLVLTALLALNVSKDILKAFAKVESSFSTTVSALEAKNNEMYQNFSDLADKKESAKPFKALADQVKSEADILNGHIEKLHSKIKRLTGETLEFDEVTGDSIPNKMDDTDKVANLLLKAPKEGEKLRLAIDRYRNFLLGLEIVQKDSKLKNEITSTFNTEKVRLGNANQKWEDANFGHYPLIAILTFLRKYQSDVVKSESDVVSGLLSSVGKSNFSFDELKAMIVPEASTIMSGDRFKADVFVTAYDSKQKPSIKITRKFTGGKPVFDNVPEMDKSKIVKGIGKLDFVASGVGQHKIGTEITIVKNDGNKQSWTGEVDYTVVSPTAVVSPTKMNVFYIGVPNPIEVSVPGVDSRNVRIGVSGATQKAAGKGGYNIFVPKGSKEVNISVSANNKRIGAPKKFRVKKIPNPVATVSGKVEGPISKGLLGRTPGVRATLKDFPFDIRFRVTSYTLRIKEGEYVRPINAKGDLFTGEMKDKFKRAKSGTDIAITNIKAASKEYPKIGIKSCPPVSLTIN